MSKPSSWTQRSREMLEYTDGEVGLEGGEFLLGVLVEISEKLDRLLEFETSDVIPVGSSSSTPDTVGV